MTQPRSHQIRLSTWQRGRKTWLPRSASTSVPQINNKDIDPLVFPLPPLAQQKRIVARADQLLPQCDGLSARLRDRQSATQQLLTATIHYLLNGVSVDE